MSNIGIFVMGAIVSLLVGGALTLLLWGAVMDGRPTVEPETATDPRSLDVAA